MQDDKRPVPLPDDVTRAFWSSLADDGVLRLQWCVPCTRPIHYPRPICPHCMGSDLELRSYSGRGRVHAFTIAYVHPDKSFADELPLVVALIDLEEGGQILSNLVSVDPDPAAIKVGMPVTLRCERRAGGRVLPKFAPAADGKTGGRNA